MYRSTLSKSTNLVQAFVPTISPNAFPFVSSLYLPKPNVYISTFAKHKKAPKITSK